MPLLEDRIENVLKERNFYPKKLSDEIRSSKDYLDRLDALIDECVLGIVILDGFRPNVLFEFGYLMGKGKPVIILKSQDAKISVKTLYNSFSESGLTQNRFNRLFQNPKIRVHEHLSDFSGKHLAYFNNNTSRDDPLHPSNILEKELDSCEEEILEEIKKVKTRGVPENDLKKIIDPITRIIRNYYTGAVSCDFDEIDKLHTELKSLVGRVPYEINSMIASTYASKARRTSLEASNSIRCYESAVRVYEEILSLITKESEPIKYSDTMEKIGDAYWELSKYKNPRNNNQKSIEFYKEALSIKILEEYPEDYATVTNDLGIAYGTLAEVEDKVENCGKAIEAFNEALRVRTSESFPMGYAGTQNNLGTAYGKLAEVEDKAENCGKAIEAFNEALRVYTLDDFPMDYAMTQNNLGAAYRTLAEVEDKVENCGKAIEAYNEALKVFSEKYPIQNKLVNENLQNVMEFSKE